MNAKVLLGFLGGLLAATGVFYVQSHRNTKAEAPPPAFTAAPVTVPAPPPSGETPAPAKVETPASARKVVAKKVDRPASPAVVPAPVEQAKVETGSPSRARTTSIVSSRAGCRARTASGRTSSPGGRDTIRDSAAPFGHHL